MTTGFVVPPGARITARIAPSAFDISLWDVRLRSDVAPDNQGPGRNLSRWAVVQGDVNSGRPTVRRPVGCML
jgi:hypothetical protein